MVLIVPSGAVWYSVGVKVVGGKPEELLTRLVRFNRSTIPHSVALALHLLWSVKALMVVQCSMSKVNKYGILRNAIVQKHDRTG